MDLINDFKQSIVEGLKSHSITNCSRWAAKRRVMSSLLTGERENYSDRHHPWCREMHNSWAGFNYSMKGAQLGVTEVAINRALYTIDVLQRDVIYVLPTTKNASKFSKSRFTTALELSPYLKGLFTDVNSVDLKQARHTCLHIVGSRGDSNLKSTPASELILDEVDEMEQKQIWLALERLSGHLQKHVWGISTPTIPNFGIHRLYKDSTQEHYTFRCPACSRWTELIWPDCVEIIGETVSDPRCAESYLKCKECGAKLEQESKPEWLNADSARWNSTAANGNPDIRGFHISQLYSFTVTPGELVVAHHRGFGDELAAKEFHNSKLGLPFVGDGAKVTDEMVAASIRHYSKQDGRPKTGGQRIITLGCDRGKWNYIVVCEWFFDGYGPDLNVLARCKVLWEGRCHEEDFDRTIDGLMREWQVLAAVVDPDPGPMEARRFARRFPGFVWLCRYRSGVTSKELQVHDDGDYAPMVHVDRAHWISATLGRFKTDPTRITLPADVSKMYQDHIKSLVSTYIRDDRGDAKLDFIDTADDHFAHAQTYNEIALPFAASLTTNQDIKSFL